MKIDPVPPQVAEFNAACDWLAERCRNKGGKYPWFSKAIEAIATPRPEKPANAR